MNTTVADTELEHFIRTSPKAELHLHIEGTLEPELMFQLADRNNIQLPFKDIEQANAAYNFANLQEFLDLYFASTQVLTQAADFQDLAEAYFAKAIADGTTHVEIFFDPQAHAERGVPIDTVMQGLLAASETAQGQGLSVGMICCFLRHLDEADAFKTLEAIEPWRENILGVGLDSTEIGHPPTKFARVFEAARKQGYHLVAHAGEEGPPEFIWEALDILGVERIDHGNAAMQDTTLMQRLAKDQIPLTMCPFSNVKLCVIDNLQQHPAKAMLDAGLKVTLNSDDPAYFGGYLADNIVGTAKALQLSRAELTTLFNNSLDARFLA